MTKTSLKVTLPVMLLLLTAACTPTVKVAVPDKPIEINLNVKIEHDIRVKVDKELDELFEEESDLF
ncbi:YnbE family lipoprotein [bacterium SCSIO 12696]|nr:YnbE family lipoprotein [bacterium SCSIO 12696]